ncbi:MAG: MmgE/PrpD family protein [Telmatospirillum sp.]|nr:MmgE/PrpD family protein [Telmatospirillum sp.]
MEPGNIDRSHDYGGIVAAHAAAAAATDYPRDVLEKGKLQLLDTLAAIVSGAALEAGIAGQRYAASLDGRPDATILGTALRAPLSEAVLANGMAAHADESDDSHEESQTHPGCGVVPSAISVAEALGANGARLLRATILGYETTIRFAKAFGAGMTFKQSSMSSHAYGPLFGAGYAAGSLMGFDAERFKILLNYLAQEASGLTTWRRDARHTLKSYVFAGMPAMNGAKCAALVRAGFSGGGDVLEMSDRNMLDAITSHPRPACLTDALGVRHEILETDIKCYPVGYPIAAPLAALEKIIGKHGVGAGETKRVRIYYNEDWYKVIGDKTQMPDVNLRYCMAVTLIDGRLTFDAAHDAERMQDLAVVAVGQRIDFLGPKPHLARFDAQVEVETSRGTFVADQDRNVLGRAENPMSKAQVQEKALDLLTTVLAADAARELIDMVDRIEEVVDIRRLVALTVPRL